MNTKAEAKMELRKVRRMAIRMCLDGMWEEFREVVPANERHRINVFLMFKELGHKMLAREAGDDILNA